MSLCGILRQSTAVNVMTGPFVDSIDGNTEETGLTIAQADVRLSKNAGADAQKNDNTTCAHEGNGFYMCELDTTDTNTVGQLTLWIHVAGALACRHDFQIVEEAVYDIVYAASATYAVPVASIAANAITATAIANDAITDAKVNSDVTIASVTGAVGSVTGAVGSVTGAVGSVTGAVGSVAAGGITAASFAANAITAAKLDPDVTTELQAGLATSAALAVVDGIVDDILLDTAEIGTAGAGLTNINLPNQTMDIAGNITGNLSGSVGSVTGAVGSVTGAVGSVTGNVGGNVTGSVGSVVGAVGSVTGNVGGTINGLTAVALKDFFDTDSTTTYASAVAGSVVKEIADNAGGASLTVQDIVDGVWDEPMASHVDAGSTGEALDDAGTAGDPWSTALPGAYGAGTAGKIVGDNVNATISSRASQTSVDDLPTNAELATALGTADDVILAAIAALNNLAAGAAMTLTAGERNSVADALLARSLGSESVSALGAVPTVAQAFFELLSTLGEFSIAGTTITCKARDGTTTLFTANLDSATEPTSRARAT